MQMSKKENSYEDKILEIILEQDKIRNNREQVYKDLKKEKSKKTDIQLKNKVKKNVTLTKPILSNQNKIQRLEKELLKLKVNHFEMLIEAIIVVKSMRNLITGIPSDKKVYRKSHFISEMHSYIKDKQEYDKIK